MFYTVSPSVKVLISDLQDIARDHSPPSSITNKIEWLPVLSSPTRLALWLKAGLLKPVRPLLWKFMQAGPPQNNKNHQELI
jgi:hypothetical protein